MIGIISAFGAAISWTYACFIWRSQTEKYESIDINLVKNLIAFLIFLPVFFNFSVLTDSKSIITLLLSGVIGIGLGDTFYIKSLKIIGTRRTLSIETLLALATQRKAIADQARKDATQALVGGIGNVAGAALSFVGAG